MPKEEQPEHTIFWLKALLYYYASEMGANDTEYWDLVVEKLGFDPQGGQPPPEAQLWVTWMREWKKKQTK